MRKKHSPVSVVIVNWNGAQYLHPCLKALHEQTLLPQEILLIDNASTDHSCQVFEDFQAQQTSLHSEKQTQPAPALRLIRNTSNQGFCRANNQGIRESQGEFVLLLNPDVILDSAFLARLVKLMHSDQMIGIVTGKLLSGYEQSKIDSTGIIIRKNRRAFDRGQREVDTGRYNEIEEVFGATGAACFYRKAMLDDIQCEGEYLDELFFMYKEDVDLSWRARLFGWKCMYTPEAVGWHYRTWGTGKRKTIPKRLRRHSLKNRYLMLLKNERWQTIRPYVFFLLWYEICSVGYILLREPYLLAIIGDIFKVWGQVMRKRRRVQQEALRRKQFDAVCAWFQ